MVAACLDELHLADIAAQPLVIFPRVIAPSLFDSVLAAYRAHGATPHIGQEAIQMQTIVNLVSAGLGIAWVPDSVRQFQRSGVVYRSPGTAARKSVPACETSLVWNDAVASARRERFVAFARSQLR